jgi:hypothetical protein
MIDADKDLFGRLAEVTARPYLARKTLPGGREAHAYPILYGARIGVGPAGSKGYDEVW